MNFTNYFSILSLLQLISSISQNVFDVSSNSKEILPIDHEIYSNLYTYAHLIDISYCISKVQHIEKPFKCNIECEDRFPNMTLVYQWYFDDSVTGYISTTYDNIFHYNRDSTKRKQQNKTIIIALRGTRSIFDSYADMRADMVDFTSLGSVLKPCTGCKVHRGFYNYFQRTREIIHQYVMQELKGAQLGIENYELVILGHSLGGSVAILLALFYLDLGFEKLTAVTMGQPLVGNREFVDWADDALGSKHKPRHGDFKRKFLRIIHKEDVVTIIPKRGNFLPYQPFDNQIYLNCSESDTRPSPDQVFDCRGASNEQCIEGDFPNYLKSGNDYLQIHITYLRRMGLCGMI